MKLVRFYADGDLRVGAIDGEDAVDARAALVQSRTLSALDAAALSDMVPLIEAGSRGLDLMAEAIHLSRTYGTGRYALKSVRLRAPLIPGLILASGGNYKDHRDEKEEAPLAGREPEYFFKTPHAVIGPDDPLELDPRVTHKLDYEVELAPVIGRTGRHIPKEKALEHVFGYTIINDVTARDRQVRYRPDGTMFYESGSSKNFDSSAPMGSAWIPSTWASWSR